MKSIRTILACIRKADQEYNLIQHGDKIVVGLSGGKDSMLLLYALSLYQKFSHTNFIVQPVTLDLGFPNFNPEPIKEYCKSLGYELIVHDSKEVFKILSIQQKGKEHLPCSICSRMKKAAINKVANEIGFNKVAFAHHADDAIETLFMNQINGGRVATFSPKMHLENANITFIRPLILCFEKDIIKTVKEENILVTPSSCPADKYTRREDIKKLIHSINQTYKESKKNFLTMISNYEKEDLWGKELEYQIDNEGLILKPVLLPYELSLSFNVRTKVFIEEQGIDHKEEFIPDEEKDAHTYLIMKNGDTIGTIRYRFINNEYKIERFAILKEYRSNHYGKKAFGFFTEMLTKTFNPCIISFHAQYYIKDYYKEFGFVEIGEPFMEAGVKHIKMMKKV